MLKKIIQILAVVTILVASGVQAGTFTNFAIGDVMLCFRPASGGSYDLVVDAGPVSAFTNALPNQRLAITNYTGTQLALIGTNSINWSAFTWFDETVTSVNARNTLFVSRARTVLTTKSQPWDSTVDYTLAEGDMASIANGGSDAISYNPNNTAKAVLEPEDNPANGNVNIIYKTGLSYRFSLGLDVNFNNDFAGNPENTTSSGFTTAGVVVRSDFYRIPQPGHGAEVYLGYFEFNTNGAMTYVAYPTAPPVTTVAASAIAVTNAQLNCTVTTVNTNTDNTAYFFQYGLTTSYGSKSSVTSVGTNSGSYGLSVSNLTAGSTYHFRAAAYNQYGTNYGTDLTFATTSGGVLVAPGSLSIVRTNIVTTIRFTTGNSGTYTLRGTNSLTSGVARTNWPAIRSVVGNGGTAILTDTNSNAQMFYIITAQ